MTRKHFAIQRSLERDGSEIMHRTPAEHEAEREAAWLAKAPLANAYLAELHRYQTDADYAAASDTDRARRQAIVYAGMDRARDAYFAARAAKEQGK
jgi:hypothetical protein